MSCAANNSPQTILASAAVKTAAIQCVWFVARRYETLRGVRLHRLRSNPFRVCSGCVGKPDGSRRLDHDGYVVIKTCGEWVREHRHIMSQHLGRELLPTEIVHHRDENRANNALENLELCAGVREHLELHHASQLKPPPRHHNGRKKPGDRGYVPIKPIANGATT